MSPRPRPITYLLAVSWIGLLCCAPFLLTSQEMVRMAYSKDSVWWKSSRKRESKAWRQLEKLQLSRRNSSTFPQGTILPGNFRKQQEPLVQLLLPLVVLAHRIVPGSITFSPVRSPQGCSCPTQALSTLSVRHGSLMRSPFCCWQCPCQTRGQLHSRELPKSSPAFWKLNLFLSRIINLICVLCPLASPLGVEL